MANYHELKGEYPQAEALMKGVLERDPLFFPARMNLGDYLRQQGNADGAIREHEKILEQDPKNIYGLILLALAHLSAQRADKGREALERVRVEDRGNYRVRLIRALALALEGKREEARRELDGEVLKASEYGIWASVAADVYAVLGDTDRALDWLERGVRVGDERLEWFRRDPLLGKVRDHPRFGQIAQSLENRRR